MIYTVNVTGDIAAFSPNAVVVNEHSALTVAGVKASVTFLSAAPSVLPKHVKLKGKIVEHSLDGVLSYRINPWTNATVGFGTLLAHVQLCGDGLMAIRRAAGSISLHNLPMNSATISIANADDPEAGVVMGEPIYEVGKNKYRYFDVIHIKTLSLDGYSGVSIVELARRTIEAAINAEELARKFLRDGFHLAGYIKVPVPLTDAQLATMQKTLTDSFKGIDNAGSAPVLPFGAEYVPLTTSAIDAQLIETRQFLIEEFSRFWGVPQHLLSKLSGQGFSSIAAMGSEVVRYVLRYWTEQLDEELTNKLLTPEEQAQGYYIECDLSYLERGDWETATTAAAALVTAGILNDNEGRDWVGKGPRDGGDGYRDPSYAMREQPAGEKPAAKALPAPEQPQEAEHASQPVDALAVLQPVLDAAVARVEAKASKALSKPLSVPQANVFADQQAGYVVQALQAFNACAQKLGHAGIDAERVAQRYADAIKRQVSTSEPADLAKLVQEVL
ncbi:MAG TPA: phage portal protein [Hymenobacter sp.]